MDENKNDNDTDAQPSVVTPDNGAENPETSSAPEVPETETNTEEPTDSQPDVTTAPDAPESDQSESSEPEEIATARYKRA